MQKKQLVFDLEFVTEKFEDLDPTTQKDLGKGLPDKDVDPLGYAKEMNEIERRMSFSPLLSRIIAIGVYDPAEDKGAVYYDAGDTNPEDTEIDGIKYAAMTEAEMLVKFWALADITDEFISFFGRRSDAPYLAIRSAINGIKPSKDLISNRYNSSHQSGAIHYDLAELLNFYGTGLYKGSLHAWCRAFKITSPKSETMSGAEVPQAYRDGRYFEIAKYNMDDIKATAKLYDYWQRYVKM
jgi:hypothetical protein